jgi:hypothetical protein
MRLVGLKPGRLAGLQFDLVLAGVLEIKLALSLSRYRRPVEIGLVLAGAFLLALLFGLVRAGRGPFLFPRPCPCGDRTRLR